MAQEELSKEEIEKRIQLMKDNCIFCKMSNKEIDSKIIFEDEICFAILDINPVANGHILLMPKEHYMMMPMVPDEVLGHLSVISKYLSDLLKNSLDCIDATIFMANGAAAGQQSQHYMLHVIPRYDGDKLDFNLEGSKLSPSELDELANKFKQRLTQGSNS
jgi:histidine triad (HIT) family protein